MATKQLNLRHWRLDFAITMIIISTVIYFFLIKFNTLQLNIERENAVAQVQNFRLSLTESWLSRNIAHKNTNINAFENTNPMLLIAELPKNYVGELAQTPQDQKSVWFYHTKMKQLIYVLSNGEILRYNFSKNKSALQVNGLPNGGLDLIAIQE